MRSSSLATLMTKKLFKIATILDDLFFKAKIPYYDNVIIAEFCG